MLSAHQSGFRANDSCLNQLLPIAHDIYTAFDEYHMIEARGVFFDISKAFNKVWHEGLLFKPKAMGISNAWLELIESFLKNRFQRVVLNGQMSEWLPVKRGLPQGSMLGPIFNPNLH